MSERVHILLVEDHTLMRAGVRLMLNSQPDLQVVGEAGTRDEVLKLLLSTQPELALVDLTLPGGSSLELIGEMLEAAPSLHILVLTMHDDPAYVRAALSMGATGYVVKTVSEHVLLSAVRAVHQGQLFVDLDDKQKTAGIFNYAERTGQIDPKQAVSKLSTREVDVLRLLGQGFTNVKIAAKLDVSPKTVATYRARICEKLGLFSNDDFVKFVHDVGI